MPSLNALWHRDACHAERLAVAAVCALLALTPAAAVESPSPGPSAQPSGGEPATAGDPEEGRCAAPEYRQLDFWVGDWQVHRPDGELAGRNEISPVAGGCALLESWQGVGGGRGTSLTYFDPETGGWRQTWVGLGVVLDLQGGWDGERMLLQGGARPGPDGPLADRISWAPRDDGEVLQLWEVSPDGGSTWERVFAGTYRPRRPVPEAAEPP